MYSIIAGITKRVKQCFPRHCRADLIFFTIQKLAFSHQYCGRWEFSEISLLQYYQRNGIKANKKNVTQGNSAIFS